MARNAEQAGGGLKRRNPGLQARASGNEINFGEEIVMAKHSTSENPTSPILKDHVYVIEFGSGLVKVGRSIHPNRRAANIASGSGRKQMRLWISPAVHGARPWEARAHAALGDFRQIGEWFKCSFEDAVSAAENAQRSEEIWSAAGQEKLAEASAKRFEMLKSLILLSANDDMSRIFARFKVKFLDDMRERAIKNCEAYLSYRAAAERCFWACVQRESSDAEDGRDIALALAYSDEEYLAASRIEHVHLGITMESCMLVLNDVEAIPAMLEEIEAIALSRISEREVTA